MDVDIYRTYRFDFDADTYQREFKKALDEAGIKKPAQFNQLFKDARIREYDYETVKSYFYRRRVLPLNIFIALCKRLNLSADKIAFPQSILKSEYDGDLSYCEDLFRNVFYPYNYSDNEDAFVDLDLLFCAETYKSDVDKIALMLSKYNYLIQKYHYAAVSKDELEQIYIFTERYIVDRNKDVATGSEQIMEWIRDCKDDEFLETFYDKYTIGFYSKSCNSLLKVLSKAIEDKFIRYAAQLLPEQDMF